MLKKTEIAQKRKMDDKDNENEIGPYGNACCYFWDGVQGKRGVNEIGSCVFNYLQRLHKQNPIKKLNVTFCSKNCCGQNKNNFMISLYSYAVTVFDNIHTSTHKYLIIGHAQNESGNVHSFNKNEMKSLDQYTHPTTTLH